MFKTLAKWLITFKCDYCNECETGFEIIKLLVLNELLKYINGSGKTQAVVVWFALEWSDILIC